MENNPFIYARTLRPQEFVGRRKELRWIFSKLATEESVAVVGGPHMGKTSLLQLLLDLKTRRELTANQFDHTIFSLLDGQTLYNVESQEEFWDLALRPLVAEMKNDTLNQLNTPYEIVERNQFGTFVLEQLFKELSRSGWRFVLILDEFDAFFNHGVLNAAEFYGGLRSLASRNIGLSLVIATRRDIANLNDATLPLNPHGSPYFNAFAELALGMLENRDLAELLDKGRWFEKTERKLVWELSGGHPYLAQVSAALLWDTMGQRLQGEHRYQVAAEGFARQTRTHFKDVWLNWTPVKRRAITAVALAQMPHLLGERAFHLQKITQEIDVYTPELEYLREIGVVAYDRDDRYWYVAQLGLVWWLAEEMWRTIRSDSDFGQWLHAQQFEGLLSVEERGWMGQMVTGFVKVLSGGLTTLVDAFAKDLVD